MKKIVLLALISVLLLSLFLPRLIVPVSAISEHWKKERVETQLPKVKSVDPAWPGADLELISNVYDTLIRFKRDSVVDFILCSAGIEDYHDPALFYWNASAEIEFHNGEMLTPEDVEYSFERLMVMDTGSAYLIYEQLLGCQEANLSDPNWMQKIDSAIESNATHVWFNFVKPYNPTIFRQIIAQPFCSILSKDWAIAQGCWDGQYTMESLQKYHWPSVSPLDDPEPVMMGTGPYKFDYFKKVDDKVEWSIYKNDDYWRGWSAPGYRGYVQRITTEFVDLETAKKNFLEGDAAIITGIPRKNVSEMLPIPEGIECNYPLPVLTCDAMFFVFNISTTSPYIGSGKLDGTGIPPDFFSDVNVRKGFAYSFDYQTYLKEAYYGEAIRPATCVIEGLPYRNPEQKGYDYNLTKAEEYFKLAWNGQLWEKGFNMTIAYNKGNEPRKIACEMLKAGVESLNPRFHINVLELNWGTYLGNIASRELPIFISGWFADYPHPYNFLYAFMHSQGNFAPLQGYSNSTVDGYIEALVGPIDEDATDTSCDELQKIYHKDCISVPLAQLCTRQWHKNWVQGGYYNPAYSGDYYYHLWPEDLPIEDVNDDGTVNIIDVATAAKAYGSYYEPGNPHPKWNSRADLNRDEKIDIMDIARVAKKYGYSAPPWTPPS